MGRYLMCFIIMATCVIPMLSNSKYRSCESKQSLMRNATKKFSYDVISDSNSCDCCQGHWPLEVSCYCENGLVWFDKSTSNYFTDSQFPLSLVNTWRFQNDSAYNSCPVCDVVIEDSIFVVIPYNKTKYQSDGSNYYVMHIDIVLPLWQHIRQRVRRGDGIPWIIPVVLKPGGGIDLHTDAFTDPRRYWISSLQNLFDGRELLPLQGIDIDARKLLCFHRVTLGVPSLHRTSDRLIQDFSTAYRKVTHHTPLFIPFDDMI